MEPILLQTSEADAGTRLDACLARAIEDLTRSAAAKAVEDGRVLVNGKAPNKSYKLTGHEQIEFTPEEPAPIDAVPQDIPLDVVYEDDDVIVVNKPSGLVVHPAPGHPDGTLVNALLYHCGDSLSGVGGALRPGIVHRIDRDTSGLIIAAKNDYAHQFLSAQLADHTLARTYECIVVGNLREDSGTVDAPIARDSRDRKRMAVVPGGRRAVTHWEIIARYPGYTHVQARNGPHASNSRAHGLPRPPDPGRHGLRRKKGRAGSNRSMPARGRAAIYPPADEGSCLAHMPAARGIHRHAAQDRPIDQNPQARADAFALFYRKYR